MDAGTLALGAVALIAAQSSASAPPAPAPPPPADPPPPPAHTTTPDAPPNTGPVWVEVVRARGALYGGGFVIADGWATFAAGLGEAIGQPDASGKRVVAYEGTRDSESARLRPVYEDGTRGDVVRLVDVRSGSILTIGDDGQVQNLVVVNAQPNATGDSSETIPPGVREAGLVRSRVGGASVGGVTREVIVWTTRELSTTEAARVRLDLDAGKLPAFLVWPDGVSQWYADQPPAQPGAPVPYVPASSTDGAQVMPPPGASTNTPRVGAPNGAPPPSPIIPDPESPPMVILELRPSGSIPPPPGGVLALNYRPPAFLAGMRVLT